MREPTGSLRMNRVLSLVLFFLSGFIPRNRKKVLFGAWQGKRFSDNPKYLLLYLARTRTDLKFIWIGEEAVRSTIPSGLPVRFVRRGSWAAVWEQLTAGSCFVTHGFGDLGSFNLMRGAKRVYLGHGLAIKHMGSRDTKLRSRFLSRLRRLQRNVYAYDYYIASSEAHREKLLVENATCNISDDQILNCGQPRIDFLLENRGNREVDLVRKRLLSNLKCKEPKLLITYLPTFRDKGDKVFSFAELEPANRERLEALLVKCDAVVLEKSHFADILRAGQDQVVKSDRVLLLGGALGIDTQELLLATDVLITDYSGCYVDFLVLDRPIVHFAYDREYYENTDRGLYFNLDEVGGGPIVYNYEDLCQKLEESLAGHRLREQQSKTAASKLIEFERGHACKELKNQVLPLALRPRLEKSAI